MTTTLIIARHGNTFNPEDTPTRVGARTDLPLVKSGVLQSLALGTWLKKENHSINHIIAGPLKRTLETANICRHMLGDQVPNVEINESLREVDYGPDENKTEAEVIARIGEDAIKNWDAHGIIPSGWNIDPEALKQAWYDIGANALLNQRDQTSLIVTSNGIARFAPYLTGDFEAFKNQFPLKLSTGALGIMTHSADIGWSVQDWNLRPAKILNI